jgi:hypothetical protein
MFKIDDSLKLEIALPISLCQLPLIYFSSFYTWDHYCYHQQFLC